MNEEVKMTTEEYLESCKDALESVKSVLENNMMKKTAGDFLKAIEITHNLMKEIYLLSQEKGDQDNE